MVFTPSERGAGFRRAPVFGGGTGPSTRARSTPFKPPRSDPSAPGAGGESGASNIGVAESPSWARAPAGLTARPRDIEAAPGGVVGDTPTAKRARAGATGPGDAPPAPRPDGRKKSFERVQATQLQSTVAGVSQVESVTSDSPGEGDMASGVAGASDSSAGIRSASPAGTSSFSIAMPSADKFISSTAMVPFAGAMSTNPADIIANATQGSGMDHAGSGWMPGGASQLALTDAGSGDTLDAASSIMAIHGADQAGSNNGGEAPAQGTVNAAADHGDLAAAPADGGENESGVVASEEEKAIDEELSAFHAEVQRLLDELARGFQQYHDSNAAEDKRVREALKAMRNPEAVDVVLEVMADLKARKVNTLEYRKYQKDGLDQVTELKQRLTQVIESAGDAGSDVLVEQQGDAQPPSHVDPGHNSAGLLPRGSLGLDGQDGGVGGALVGGVRPGVDQENDASMGGGGAGLADDLMRPHDAYASSTSLMLHNGA